LIEKIAHCKMSLWKQETWRVVTITQMVSASISLSASLMISIMIARGSGGLKSPYRRLIFCLSICDIIQSSALLLGPLMIPSNIENSWGIGNDATCQMNAVGFTFGSTGILAYFCFLCVYYLCRLKYRMNDKFFNQKIEKRVHLFILALNVLSVGAGLGLGTFHVCLTRSFCHYAATPLYCRIFPEKVGKCDLAIKDRVDVLILINVFILNIIGFCMIAGIMVILYRHANFLRGMNSSITTSASLATGTTTLVRRAKIINKDKNCDMNNKSSEVHGQNLTIDEFKDDINGEEERSNSQEIQQTCRDNNSTDVARSCQKLSELSALYRRETIIQATCYVGVYCLTYLPTIVLFLSVATHSDGKSVVNVSVLIIASCFYPCTGLFISLVYTRPKVTLIRRTFPQCSRLLAFWLVLKAGGEVPELEHLNIPVCCNCQNDNHNSNNNDIDDNTGTDNRSKRGKKKTRFFNSAEGIDGVSQSVNDDDVNFNAETNWSYVQGEKALDAIFYASDTNRSNKQDDSDLTEDPSLWNKTVEGCRFISSLFIRSDDKTGHEGMVNDGPSSSEYPNPSQELHDEVQEMDSKHS